MSDRDNPRSLVEIMNDVLSTVRGQKTKTNARTCKGPKRTVANKKK